MGLVSKELSSGSIKLLYSSPVSNTQIILGKFCAMMGFALVMCLMLSVYVVVALCTVQDFELAVVLTGLLGLFLLTCTYAAVGIFCFQFNILPVCCSSRNVYRVDVFKFDRWMVAGI